MWFTPNTFVDCNSCLSSRSISEAEFILGEHGPRQSGIQLDPARWQQTERVCDKRLPNSRMMRTLIRRTQPSTFPAPCSAQQILHYISRFGRAGREWIGAIPRGREEGRLFTLRRWSNKKQATWLSQRQRSITSLAHHMEWSFVKSNHHIQESTNLWKKARYLLIISNADLWSLSSNSDHCNLYIPDCIIQNTTTINDTKVIIHFNLWGSSVIWSWVFVQYWRKRCFILNLRCL